MERRDNYAIAAARARQLFVNYDHAALARKLRTQLDETYLYTKLLGEPYRIHRTTGDISRFSNGEWVSANSFNESLTLLDLVCDSRDDRFPSGRWKNMSDFGHQFHRDHLETTRDPQAEFFEANASGFAAACEQMGGRKYPLGDVAYSIEVFDGLCILIQLWFGDDEFPAQLRWLWDENALQYLKYETMFYAVGLIRQRLNQKMGRTIIAQPL